MRKIFAFILTLVVLLLTLLAGCQEGGTTADTGSPFDGNINWTLHGVWVDADGAVLSGLEKVVFDLVGTVPMEYEMYDTVEMELDFRWPTALEYQNQGVQTYSGGASLADKHNNEHIYHGAGWIEGFETLSLGFTICPELEYVILHIGDHYLVASTQPNLDSEEIMDFYKTYVAVN